MLFVPMWYLYKLSKYEQFNRGTGKELEKLSPSIWVYAVLLNAPQSQHEYSHTQSVFKGLRKWGYNESCVNEVTYK
jgi:hypothetical protein